MSKKIKRPFRNNRYKVQQFYQQTNFLKGLSKQDLPISIKEGGVSSLKEVVIKNFPVSNEIAPKSWLLDLENKTPLLASNNYGIQTAEKALLLFTYDKLIIFMVEMKASLQSKGSGSIDSIKEKLEHTMGRISMLLTSYILDTDEFQDIKNIEYKGLIFYNRDAVRVVHDELQKTDLYKILKGTETRIYLDNPITGKERVEVFFIKNEDEDSTVLEFDFDKFFPEDVLDYQARYTEFTLPTILKKDLNK